MNRAIKWFAIIGLMVGYGELRVISIYAAIVGVLIGTCALVYTVNDIQRRGKKRRMDDEQQ